MRQVVVIGAGIAGLSAAHRLLRAGNNVALCEGGRIGGLVQTESREGFTLELGAGVLVEKEPIAKLIDELGLRGNIVYPATSRYRQYVWYKGAPALVPRSPLQLIKTPLLSTRSKLLLIRGLFKAGSELLKGDDESLQAVFTRLIGEDGVRNLLDPALQGIYGGDVSKLSIRSVFPELSKALLEQRSLFSYGRGKSRKNVFVLRGGNHILCETLWQRIEGAVHFVPEYVTSLSKEGGQFSVKTPSENLTADEVVIASCGARSAAMVESLLPEMSLLRAETPFTPIVVVHCEIPDHEKLPSDAFGILFPSGQASHLLGMMFTSQMFPHVAPRGKQLLTLMFGGTTGTEVLERTDGEIRARAQDELRDRLGLRNSTVIAITRWHDAIPQFGVGHHRTVAALRAAAAKIANLSLVGADIEGAGVPERVRVALGN